MGKSVTSMFVLAVVFLMITQPLSATGKTSSSEVSKEMKEAWETFKSYVADEKDDAVIHGNEMLKKADTKIEEMENEASKASGDAKTEYDKEIKKLKTKRAEAADKLDDLQNSSAEAWESTKEGFSKAYKDLHDTYEEAASKFE